MRGCKAVVKIKNPVTQFEIEKQSNYEEMRCVFEFQ
jgi:hypothetical protein